MSNESKALELAVKSRLLCKKLRTTPMSISDLIPHLQATADAVERQHAQIEALEKQLEAVRKDAERLDAIEKNCRTDPKVDGNHVYWPTTWKHSLKGPNLRAAIDAANERT